MTNKTLYKGFTLIDGNGESPVERAWFLVEDKKVLKIGQGNEHPDLDNAQVVDLSGKTVMPGLINCHVHITMDPVADPFSLISKETDAETTLRGVANLKKHLKAGTTYFRDVGAPNGIDLALRNGVKEGLVEGPEFLVACQCLTMTGGHGWPMGREADGPDELRKAAREQLKKGADVVKIMATGGVMTPGVEPGSPQLSKEEMETAIYEAHKAGKKTATHAQGTEGIKNAVLAGIDSVEHGIFLDDEVIELMVKRGVYLVPTLVAPYFIVKNGTESGIPEFAVKKAKMVMESHMDSFRKAHEAGVKIAMGTDAGTPFNFHDKAPYELKLMVEGGMTPMEAVVASTKTASELLGIDKDYGTLEEDKFADFIVLDENPLDNLDTLFNINKVYKLGKLVK
ncbi:Amidohydrolase [[Clostridium] ultunense Esp]|uniref:Amidohydrolase n=1 Tax=[Clostridium] ultunense Esp TaxID=1288971 RepID=M1ZLP5_9FIRM|nr:amidohydrolase family protein [Schnuerera ultunensis]CCQ97562.1 Amidohydrolase [[Clostridium] ultunense Esp]SHD77464.1 Amidohydrolase [[Clostridium] ultunense Esp]